MSFSLKNERGTEKIVGERTFNANYSFKAMWDRIDAIEDTSWLKDFPEEERGLSGKELESMENVKSWLIDAIKSFKNKKGNLGSKEEVADFINQRNNGCNFYEKNKKIIEDEIIGKTELTPYVKTALRLFLLIHIYGGIGIGEKELDKKREDKIEWESCTDITGKTSVELMRFLLEKAADEPVRAKFKKEICKRALEIKVIDKCDWKNGYELDKYNKRTIFKGERLYAIGKEREIVDILPRAAVSGTSIATAMGNGIIEIRNVVTKEARWVEFTLSENEEIASWCFDEKEGYVIAVTTKNRVLADGIKIGECEGVMACCSGSGYAVLTCDGKMAGSMVSEPIEGCVALSVGQNSVAAIDKDGNVIISDGSNVMTKKCRGAAWVRVNSGETLISAKNEARKYFAGDRMAYFEENRIMLEDTCVCKAEGIIEEMIVSDKMAAYRTEKDPTWKHVLWKDEENKERNDSLPESIMDGAGKNSLNMCGIDMRLGKPSVFVCDTKSGKIERMDIDGEIEPAELKNCIVPDYALYYTAVISCAVAKLYPKEENEGKAVFFVGCPAGWNTDRYKENIYKALHAAVEEYEDCKKYESIKALYEYEKKNGQLPVIKVKGRCKNSSDGGFEMAYAACESYAQQIKRNIVWGITARLKLNDEMEGMADMADIMASQTAEAMMKKAKAAIDEWRKDRAGQSLKEWHDAYIKSKKEDGAAALVTAKAFSAWWEKNRVSYIIKHEIKKYIGSAPMEDMKQNAWKVVKNALKGAEYSEFNWSIAKYFGHIWCSSDYETKKRYHDGSRRSKENCYTDFDRNMDNTQKAMKEWNKSQLTNRIRNQEELFAGNDLVIDGSVYSLEADWTIEEDSSIMERIGNALKAYVKAQVDNAAEAWLKAITEEGGKA